MIGRSRPVLRLLVVAALAVTSSCGGSDEEDFGPAPHYPVLWASTYSKKAPWGEVVMMKARKQ